MIPAVFSPYADRTPKSLGASRFATTTGLPTELKQRVRLGLAETPRQPAAARSMQAGVGDEEIAAPASLRTAHAARNGASADVFYPALTLKRGAASRREAARRIRQPP